MITVTILIIIIFYIDDFNEYIKLVLINAIYFNGNWLYKFNEKNTEKKAFHVTKNEQKFVPTMFNKSKYNYGKIPTLDSTFIEIPYMVCLNV